MFPELKERLQTLFARNGMTSLQLKSMPPQGSDGGWYARNGFNMLAGMHGYGPSWSGATVTVESALQHSVVWACNRIVSESVGFIPAIMLQRKGDATRPATEHPMYNAMLHAPDEDMTAQTFTEGSTSHCLMQGNGYAQIIRRSGTGVSIGLRQLRPEVVMPDREKTGQKRLVYVVKERNQPDQVYTVERGKPHDILHLRGLGWDGIRGYSVITMGTHSIGTALSSERNVAGFYRNGGRLPYYLKMEGKFKNDQEFEQFRYDWERTYSEPHRAPILQPPISEYHQIGLSAKDAQLLETRVFHINDICRWFGVSPHLVGDLSRATFSNVENLALQFVTFTLAPWLTRWEEEFWRCVLTDQEKAAGYFLRHDTNALLRGDFKTRMEGYASALQNGHMSVDDVREREGENPLPDGAGSHYHIQLNMQTLPEGDQPLTSQIPKQGGLVRLDQ